MHFKGLVEVDQTKLGSQWTPYLNNNDPDPPIKYGKKKQYDFQLNWSFREKNYSWYVIN